MGQLLLTLFPHDVRMITLTLGVREANGTIYYLLSGMPIFSHEADDLTKFRYITSNLILQGLCSNQDIVDAFHVSTDSVRRWKKKLSEESLNCGKSIKLLGLPIVKTSKMNGTKVYLKTQIYRYITLLCRCKSAKWEPKLGNNGSEKYASCQQTDIRPQL